MANEDTNQIRSNNEYHKVARQHKKLFELKMQDSIGEWGDYDEQELDRLSNLLQEYERLHPEVLPHQHIEMSSDKAPTSKWAEASEEWPATEAAHQRMAAPKWQPTREQEMWAQTIATLETEQSRLLGENDRLRRKVEVMETARQQHFAERNELQNDNASKYRELRRWRRGELVHDKHKTEFDEVSNLKRENDSLRHSANNYQELYEQRAESLEKAEGELANLRDAVAGWKVSNEQFHARNEQLRAEIDRLRAENMAQHGIVRPNAFDELEAAKAKAERLSMDLRKCREGRDRLAAQNKGLNEQLVELREVRDIAEMKNNRLATEAEGLREQLAEWERYRDVFVALQNAIRKANEMLSVPSPTPDPVEGVDFEWVQRGFKHEPGGGINS